MLELGEQIWSIVILAGCRSNASSWFRWAKTFSYNVHRHGWLHDSGSIERAALPGTWTKILESSRRKGKTGSRGPFTSSCLRISVEPEDRHHGISRRLGGARAHLHPTRQHFA